MRSIYTIYRYSWTFYDVLYHSTRAHKVHMTLLWAFSSRGLSACRVSFNISITSSPINICRRTIPTAWISRWRVYRREDSFWTSLESLKTKMSMQGGIWMGWFKRLPCFRNLEFVLYKWCMWSERIGTMEIEESCMICYSSELDNFRLSSIISGC